MNRRFANLCRAADGGFRPNVIPNPSCVRTRARSRAISRPDARSFRKTSREILFATLSTLASEASTYLDVRARRIAIGALRDGKKIIFVSIAFDGRQSPLGQRLAPSIPRMDKTGEPDPPRALARVFASSSSGAHTRDRVAHLSAVALCVKDCIMFVSDRRHVVPSPSPRVRLAPSRARASSASSTPSVRSGFTIGAFFSHRARVSYSHCFYAIIPPIARVPSPRGDLEPNLARAPASCPRPDRTDGFRMRPERRVRVVVVARAVVECA